MSEKPAIVPIVKESAAEKPIAFENLRDRANTMFDAIARRAYEIFSHKSGGFGRELDDWFQAERELLHPVHIHVTESGEELEVKAEVPGFNEKELDLLVEPRKLTISGKREMKAESKKGKTIYSETCSDQIFRVFELPAEVETEKVTAVLKNGVLEMKLPKVAKARTVPVEPKVAA